MVMAYDCLPKSLQVMAEMVPTENIKVMANNCLPKSIQVMTEKVLTKNRKVFADASNIKVIKETELT